LVVALGGVYLAVTNHVWEDYFITFRHSRNLAEGSGLVFQVGERVHGFTSPLGVLLPAGFHWLFGNLESYAPALNAFRALSLAALAVGVLQAVRWASPSGGAWWAIAVGAVFAVDPKVIGFAVNGQEAGLMFALLAWTMRLSSDASSSAWRSLGLAWAGLQWTRPDGFVFGGAWALAELACPGAIGRRALLARFFKAACLAVVLYAPWPLFCTLYYGSPVPHTIVAKSGLMPRPETWDEWRNVLIDRLSWLMQPTNAFFGDWPPLVARFGRTVAIAGACAWIVAPFTDAGRAVRRASLAYLVVLGYFCVIPLAAWYLPPAILLLLGGIVALALCAPMRAGWLLIASYAVTVLIEENRLKIGHSLQNTLLIAGGLWTAAYFWLPRRAATGTVLAALFAFLACQFGGAVWQIRVQQQVVEFDHRREIGMWLRAHVRADETVYLECLGYIGYFSGRRMLDFPGLASPRVVQAHRSRTWDPKELPIDRMAKLIPDLNPDWLVLRPHEWSRAEMLPGVSDRYRLAKEFSVSERLEAEHSRLPGLAYLRADARFMVFKRLAKETTKERAD
jgi:hypothetical protein